MPSKSKWRLGEGRPMEDPDVAAEAVVAGSDGRQQNAVADQTHVS